MTNVGKKVLKYQNKEMIYIIRKNKILILRFLYCKGDIKVISRHHYFTRKSDEKGNLRFLLTFSTA